MTNHRNASGDLIHTPYRQIFANAAARTGDTTVYTIGDLYKKALQVDTQQEYVLTSVGPTVWTATAGGGGSVTHASTTGQTANDHHNQIHALGGGDHTSATLAELNALVSDATLDDSSATRTPSAHTIVSHSDTTATGTELNTLTDGSNADALHTHAGAGLTYDDTLRTTSFNAAANTFYRVSSDAFLTMSLPDAPADGSEVWAMDGQITDQTPDGLLTIDTAGAEKILWPLAASLDGDNSFSTKLQRFAVGFKYSATSNTWTLIGGESLTVIAGGGVRMAATDSNGQIANFSVGVNTLVGRTASGDILGMTATQARTVLNVADGATAGDADAIHDNVAGEIAAVTGGTVASGDLVLIEDVNDSNNKKSVTAQSIADLGGGGGGGVADTTQDATASTTSTTPNNIDSYTTLNAARVITIRATIFAYQTAGTGTGDAAKWVVEVTAERTGSTVTILDENFVSVHKDNAAWDVTFSVSSLDIDVNVIGIATDNINWRSQLEVSEHG